jgi:hypothetical protein
MMRSSMIRPSYRRILALALVILPPTSALAEFSPLSIHPEGFGMPVAPMGARERAMGEAGMASAPAGGFFLSNPARSAFHDKTVFTATLENDVDWLRDDNSSARMSSGAFPGLATLVKTKNFGTFGAYYQQTYLRNFETRLQRSGDTSASGYVAEGGLYTLGASWGIAVRPWLSVGIAQNLVLGRDRYIRPVNFGDEAPPEAEDLADTTLETSAVGAYPTLSVMFRLPRNLDLALGYSHSADLDVSRSRTTNSQGSDGLADTTMKLPQTFSVGAAWRPDRRQTAVFDFVYENWDDTGLLNPAWSAGAGYEFRASQNPFDGLLKRTAWRAGAGYKMLYLREVPEVYATAGFGMPLGPRGHQLDFSLKYGHRRYDGNTFFSEDYLKVSASVVGVSVWGQPARKRR